MTLFRVLFLSAIFALPSLAQAQSGEALYFGIRNDFQGTRAMGMGNAFSAVADDNTAIFYNPAGLSQLTEGESNWFIKLDADPEIKPFYDDIDAATNASNSTQEITSVIQKNYGQTYSMRLPSMGFMWARPNWGVAFIPLDLSIDMGLNRNVGPGVNLIATQDSTLAFTYNWKIKKWRKAGTFNVGVTSKLIYRMNANKVVNVSSIDQNNGEIFKTSDAKEGLTLDADVGLLWKGPWQSFNPSAALVIRNIGAYGYLTNMSLVGKGTGDPDKLNRVIDLGYAMDLPSWWIWTTKVSFDIRNMLHPNWTVRKGTHLGAEFMWQVSSWFRGGWRAGLNQGYITAGFTGEFGVFKLDVATYGEEIGVEGAEAENRRYMMTMSLDF